MQDKKGFTLIEVLIVIVIIMTLIGLVAPLGIKQVERAQVKNDLLEVKRFIINASNLSFSTGKALNVNLSGNRITVEDSDIDIKLKRVTFEQSQKIIFNRNGYPSIREITYHSNGNQLSLDLFAIILPVEFGYIYAP